jgi:hypothetical protein
VDVARLQREPTKAVTGRMGARFVLQTRVRNDVDGLLRATSGTIDLEIGNGRMPGIEVIRQAVLRVADRATPAPPGKSTDAFSRIDASLTLDSGAARITRLAMAATDFDLAGSGALSLASGRIALDVDVTLTEALSQQAGRDLYRYAREGRRIVLPATIGGTIAQPTVSIDLAEAAGRALKNRVEDEMRSILDRVIRRKRPPR